MNSIRSGSAAEPSGGSAVVRTPSCARGAARLCTENAIPGLPGVVRFEGNSADAWFEEDEQVFVHPGNPSKGTTSGYWSVKVGETVHPDLAWAYDFPTRQLQPIAGLIAFYGNPGDRPA